MIGVIGMFENGTRDRKFTFVAKLEKLEKLDFDRADRGVLAYLVFTCTMDNGHFVISRN